jgi:hypothetical protein
MESTHIEGANTHKIRAKSGATRRSLTLAALLASGALRHVSLEARAADTIATWNAPTSDTWTNASDWSTNPAYPNNAMPAGVNYQAVIAATGSPYTVSLDSDVSVDGLILNSADATLSQTEGTFQASTLTLDAGSLAINGGTFANSSIVDTVGEQISVQNATFSNDHLSQNTDLFVNSSGSLTIQNGLTADGSAILLSSGASVIFDGASRTLDDLGIVMSLTSVVQVGGPTSGANCTLTIDSSANVSGAGTITGIVGSTLVNNSTINGSSITVPLTISTPNFINNGTIKADNNTIVTINSSSWINQGTIEASQFGIVNLGGTFTPADIGNVQHSTNGIINITGTLDVSGTTMTFNNVTGPWTLNGGTIKGGIIDQSQGQNLLIDSGVFDGVTIEGNDFALATFRSSTLSIVDGINNGTDGPSGILDLPSPNFLNNGSETLTFDGISQTIGNITIRDFQVNSNSNSIINIGGPTSPGPVTVTIGPKATISSSGPFRITGISDPGSTLLNEGIISVFGQGQLIQQVNLINNGTITADGTGGTFAQLNISGGFSNNATVQALNHSSIAIQPITNWSNAAGATMSASNDSNLDLEGTYTNLGSISVTGGSTLHLGGIFTLPATGSLSISADSTVNLVGTLNNTGSVFTPTTGTWTLFGTVLGGIFDEAQMQSFNFSGTFNGVEVEGGDLKIAGGLTITNGLTIDDHNLDLLSGQLTFANTESLNGISLNCAGGSIFVVGSSTTLTLGSDTIIHGYASIGASAVGRQSSVDGAVVNNGIVNADSSLGVLSIARISFTNNATIESMNGGTLDLSAATFINNGIIRLQGGTIKAPSAGLNVGDGTLSGDGTINGNVILASDPSALAFDIGGTAQGVNFDLLMVDGNMTLAGDLQISLIDGFQSTITSSDLFDVLIVESPFSLSGSFLNVPSGGRLETIDELGSFEVFYSGSGQYAREIVLTNFQSGNIPEPTTISILLVESMILLRRPKRGFRIDGLNPSPEAL